MDQQALGAERSVHGVWNLSLELSQQQRLINTGLVVLPHRWSHLKLVCISVIFPTHHFCIPQLESASRMSVLMQFYRQGTLSLLRIHPEAPTKQHRQSVSSRLNQDDASLALPLPPPACISFCPPDNRHVSKTQDAFTASCLLSSRQLWGQNLSTWMLIIKMHFDLKVTFD